MAITKIKRKNGFKYKVKVRDLNNEYFPIRTFETKLEAKDHEAALLLLKKKGASSSSKEFREMTFAGYWERWSETSRTEVSEGWKLSQNQMFKDHVRPVLGEKKLIELGKPEIADLMSRLKKKGLGPQTRLHVFSLVHKMFEDSIHVYDARETNPAVNAFKPEPPKVERNFLRADVSRAFLKAVKYDYLGPAVWIMINCGLRPCEFIGLRWGCVDFGENEILIKEQWIRKEKRFGPTKNGIPIRVPMAPELAEYLKSRRPDNAGPEDFVLRGTRTGGHLPYYSLYKGIKRLCTNHGVPMLTPHELRHTCSELWIDSGATKEDLRRLFNHSNDKSTEKYIHRTEERLRRLSSTINAPAKLPLRLVK